MILNQLDPKLDKYDWREHVLFWRLDALHLARTYAVLYLQQIAELLSPSGRRHVEAAIEQYRELLRIFDANVQIIFPPASDELHTNLLWCEGEKERPIRELFATIRGRRQFAEWLLKMRVVEEKAIRALAQAVEEEE